MAKPDMPYGLFPRLVPAASTPAGALAVDLATAMKWFWRVKSWTAYFAGSFSASFNMSDSTAIRMTASFSVLETFDVLASGLDELSLCQSVYPGGYQWIVRPSPVVSGSVVVTDPDNPSSPLTYPGFFVSSSSDDSAYSRRSMFAPGYFFADYRPDGFHCMTRDAISGLYTPFLGPYGPPLWSGNSWGVLFSEGSGEDFNGNCIISNEPEWIDGVDGLNHTGSQSITVAGSVDGHAFSCPGFVQWGGSGMVSEAGSRLVNSVTYGGDGAISLVITPLEYWTYAPRIDSGNPTYDSGTGAIANNPATGMPWTIQEIISRHGP